MRANLDGVDLRFAKSLTQEQLDSAECDAKTKSPAGLTVNVKLVVEQDVNQAGAAGPEK